MRVVATADEFLNSPAMARQKMDVPVPELGEGKVIPIWGMTPKERTEFESKKASLPKSQQAQAAKQIRERILVECCRNDDGVQLFTADQISALSERRGDVVERLVNVALELSGFNEDDLDALVKKSDAAPVS